MKAFIRNFAVLLCFSALTSSANANNATTGFVNVVYVHDCCGRGPYVALVFDRDLNSPPGCSINPRILATSPAAPLAKHLMATAMAAKLTGKQVTVWGKGSCDSTGVFDEWIGITME